MPSAAPTRSFKLGSPGRALAKATAWCVAWVILAFPGRGEAAISFVRMHGNIAESGQAATSMSAGIGAPIAVGNTVLVAFSTTFLTGTVSCGDSRGNVYTVDADYVASGSRLVVCSSSVTTMLTSPNTVNVSFAANSGGRVLIVTEFSGIRAAADRFDQFAKGHTTANSTAVSTDTVTLSQPDELLFGLVAADGPSGDALLLGQDGTSRPYTLLTKYGVSTQTLSVGYLTTTATGPYGMINATANPAHRLTAGVATYRAPAFGAASRLAFNVQPSNAAAGASLSPAVRVAIQDSSGNTVATSAASVTLAIGTNPGTSTLSGTVTASAVSGIATFSNLSLNNAGTGYRLQASSGALTPAVSSAFNVLGGSPTKLAIVTPAHSVAAGTCSAAVTVEARDAYDNPATLSGSATVNVTLSGAQLFSDSTCTTAFSSLALSTATSQGSAYFRGTVAGALTLNASSAGLTGTSQQEMVVAGAATTLEVHDFPAMVTAGQAANVTLTARDAFGNVATTFVGALQLSSSDPAAQVPSGLAMSAGNQGELVASVTLKTAGTRDLRASSGGLMGTQSGILVRHAFLHHLMVSGVPSPTRVGNWADLTVEAHDPYDNVVADYTGTVQLSSSDAQASLAPAFAFTLAQQGAAAITQAVRFRAPGTHSVVASDTGNALLYGAQTGIVVEADPPPVIQHNANLKAAVGVPYRFNGLGRIELTGIGTVTYEACGGPSGFRVDGLAGSVHWVPDAVGSVSLCVKASSSAGADTYNFTVNVIARTATDVTARLVATPSSGAVPLSVQLDGMLSQVAADATPLMFRWELGDGSPLLSAASPAHSYLLPGGYRARLTVYDAFGAKGEADELIRVARANGDVPPSARIRASSTRGIDELQVELACDCQAGSAPIAAYSWQLGNGQTESGDKTRALYGAGAHEVLLTVIDTAGLSATDRVQISVSRGDLLPPQCSATADALAGAAPFTTTWKGHALAGSGAVTKVEWDLEGEVSSGFAVSRKYDVPGAHWGRFRVEDNNGLACESVAWIVATAAGRTPPQIVSTPPSVSLVCSKPYVYQPVAVGEGPREWSLSDAPDGMVVDAATGEVRWPSATAAGLGAHSVTLVVRGPSGEAVQQFSVERSCDTSSVFTGCGCRSSAGVMPFGLAALALLLARTRGSRER